MVEINSLRITILGIGTRMGAMILAEVGDSSQFDSPDKILAYCLYPTLYKLAKSCENRNINEKN